jgi:hypothetical protein
MGGLGSVRGVLAVGDRNVIVGNNENIISMGSDIIIDYGVSNALVFGGGYVTASNVVAFGSLGATLSTPDTFNFGTLNPVISENNPSEVNEGMIRRDGDRLEIWDGANWVSAIGAPVVIDDRKLGDMTWNIPNQYEDLLATSVSKPGTYLVSVNLNLILGNTGSASPKFTTKITSGATDYPEKVGTVAVSGEEYMFSYTEIVTAGSGDQIIVKGKTNGTPLTLKVNSKMDIVKIL